MNQTEKTKAENKIKAKRAFAEKYERLAVITNSKPKRRTFKGKAKKYAAQVEILERFLQQG